jgi:hypothetical protein
VTMAGCDLPGDIVLEIRQWLCHSVWSPFLCLREERPMGFISAECFIS